MNNEREFKGIWIPAKVWLSKELTLQEKVFLVEIDSLDNKDGCYANNRYFAEFFGISTVRVSKVINSLVDKEFIISEIHQDKGNKRVLKVANKCFTPHKQSINTSQTKVNEGHKQKFIHSNTINNTINNDVVVVVDFQQSEIGTIEKFTNYFENTNTWKNQNIDWEHYFNSMLDFKPKKEIKNWIALVSANLEKKKSVNQLIFKKEKVAQKRKRFVKPTVEEIKTEAQRLNYPNFNTEAFYAYYESNGWKVGRNKMVSWSAAMVNWNKREKNNKTNNNEKSDFDKRWESELKLLGGDQEEFNRLFGAKTK